MYPTPGGSPLRSPNYGNSNGHIDQDRQRSGCLSLLLTVLFILHLIGLCSVFGLLPYLNPQYQIRDTGAIRLTIWGVTGLNLAILVSIFALWNFKKWGLQVLYGIYGLTAAFNLTSGNIAEFFIIIIVMGLLFYLTSDLYTMLE